MDKINLANEEFEVIDSLEKISIADSFVSPQNKIGGGNGEAKLYVGQTGEKLRDFFGSRGFEANCFLSKQNLNKYLDNAYSEYKEPTQEYRNKNSLSSKWELRKNKIERLDEVIPFKIKDQNQLVGPRLYVSSADNGYQLIREISLPVISYINIYKLKDATNSIKYFFKISLNDYEDNIHEISEIKKQDIDARFIRFIPSSDDEIEKEWNNSNEVVVIKSPFDPNKIKVRTTPSTIGQIINDLEDKIINLDTEFQRLPNLWDNQKKSRFIESLLLKLPIPAFYFNEKEENDLEVIDGLQRISTIESFVIKKTLKLEKLEFLKDYEGYSFDDLPSTLSRRIKTFTITTNIIEKGTPDEVKYNIFKRVNTGGLILKPQEIRHAINQGEPSRLIAELVRSEDDVRDESNILKTTREGLAFVKATDYRIQTDRMEDRDFATRFVSFYLIPYKKYKPDLDTFLNIGMAKIKTLSNEEIDNLKNDFYKAMTLAYDIFGDDAFRKRFKNTDSRKPINKALFEVLSVCFSKRSTVETERLKLKKESFIQKFINLHNKEDGAFLRAITQGTAQESNVIKRFTDIENIIKETLEND